GHDGRPGPASPRSAAANARPGRGGATGARSSSARSATPRDRRSRALGGACRARDAALARTERECAASVVKLDNTRGRHSNEIERQAEKIAQRTKPISFPAVAAGRGDALCADPGEAAATE